MFIAQYLPVTLSGEIHKALVPISGTSPLEVNHVSRYMEVREGYQLGKFYIVLVEDKRDRPLTLYHRYWYALISEISMDDAEELASKPLDILNWKPYYIP